MATRAVLVSREAIKKVAGNDGTFKRGLEVQASNKMTEIEFSGQQLVHGKAKCEGEKKELFCLALLVAVYGGEER